MVTEVLWYACPIYTGHTVAKGLTTQVGQLKGFTMPEVGFKAIKLNTAVETYKKTATRLEQIHQYA